LERGGELGFAPPQGFFRLFLFGDVPHRGEESPHLAFTVEIRRVFGKNHTFLPVTVNHPVFERHVLSREHRVHQRRGALVGFFADHLLRMSADEFLHRPAIEIRVCLVDQQQAPVSAGPGQQHRHAIGQPRQFFVCAPQSFFGFPGGSNVDEIAVEMGNHAGGVFDDHQVFAHPSHRAVRAS